MHGEHCSGENFFYFITKSSMNRKMSFQTTFGRIKNMKSFKIVLYFSDSSFIAWNIAILSDGSSRREQFVVIIFH